MQPHLLEKILGKIWANLANVGEIWINLGKSNLNLGKFNYIWTKSKSCISKNTRSPTRLWWSASWKQVKWCYSA